MYQFPHSWETLKRVEGGFKYSNLISQIPCRELSGKVYRCYHKAHTDALRRFEAEGGEESTWPAFRTVEVLGCEGVVQDFLECAGKARSAFISAQPISAA